MIRCIVIQIEANNAKCDGTVHEYQSEKEFHAFADGVKEASSLLGVRMEVYTKDAKLPPTGDAFIKKFLLTDKESK